MRIAISGARGFIGRAVGERLSTAGFETIEFGGRDQVDLARWGEGLECDEFDLFIHLAAHSYVPSSRAAPRDFYENNFLATLNALELCRNQGAPMLLTSSYVYGHPDYLPVDESHPVRGFNPYAESKLLSEQVCAAYWRDFDVPICVVRPFNAYGPGQAGHFLIPKIMEQATTGRISLEDPRPKRDWLHVDDLAAAYEAIVRRGISGHETFNLGSGVSHSVAEVVELVSRHFNIEQVDYAGAQRSSDPMDIVADISHATSTLGWKPEMSLESGIADLAAHERRRGSTRPARPD